MELSDKSPVLRFSWQSSGFSGGSTIGTSASGAPKPNSLVASNMNVLIIKLGTAGDVVRTTTLLRRLGGQDHMANRRKKYRLAQGSEGRSKMRLLGAAGPNQRHSITLSSILRTRRKLGLFSSCLNINSCLGRISIQGTLCATPMTRGRGLTF